MDIHINYNTRTIGTVKKKGPSVVGIPSENELRLSDLLDQMQKLLDQAHHTPLKDTNYDSLKEEYTQLRAIVFSERRKPQN